MDIYELSRSGTLASSTRGGSNSYPHRVSRFQAHARRLSDLSWSSHHDNLLVCCSELDSLVNFWDIRQPLKPCQSLELAFGAGQAKFSPHHDSLLMTSHGCDLRLWDYRVGLREGGSAN